MRNFFDNRGQAITETVILIPVLLLFLFGTFQLFDLIESRQLLQEASRYAVWEKVVGRDTAEIENQVRTRLETGETAIETITLSMSASDSADPWYFFLFKIPPVGFGDFLGFGFNVPTDNLWTADLGATVKLRHFPIASRVAHVVLPKRLPVEGGPSDAVFGVYAETGPELTPGQAIPLPTIAMVDRHVLVTDSWRSTSQDEVRDRIRGGWLLGRIGGGVFDIVDTVMGVIRDILDVLPGFDMGSGGTDPTVPNLEWP